MLTKRILLVALPALAAFALLVASEPELPSGLLQRALCGLDEASCPTLVSQTVDRRRGAEDPSAPRQPVRRVSQNGYHYGECGGVISAALLFPEPCDGLWQGRPIPLEDTQD